MDESVTIYDTAIIKDIDHVFRISSNSEFSDEVQIQPLGETRSLAYGINTMLSENEILKLVTKNLWKTYRYNQEYISFLLGSYSEGEFREIAKGYAEPINKNADIDFLHYASNVIFSYFEESLTSYDLSVLLNVDCSTIDENLQQIGYITEEISAE